MFKKSILILVLLLCNWTAYGNENAKKLLQEKAALKQSWLLSKNYAFGLTVEKDPFKALAWQYVYVTLLPYAYPGSYSLLDPFKDKVEKIQHDLALEVSKSLRREYNLPSRMDENQLIRVFQAKESLVQNSLADDRAYPNFKVFIEAVNKISEETAFIYNEIWHQGQNDNLERQMVYGKVLINGGQLEQTIVRNQHLEISKDGFFIGYIHKNLLLTVKGYQSYKYTFNKFDKPTSLGVIVLNKYPENKLASIVGSVKPAKNIKNAELTLQFKNQYLNKEQPWFSPTIPVTKLDNGQFYIKGLAPGEYKIILSYNGEKQALPVTVKASQVKTLKPINL